MASSPIAAAVSKAKSTLAKSSKDFPSSMANDIVPKAATPKAQTRTSAQAKKDDGMYQGVGESLHYNAEQAAGLPKYHKGGIVEETGPALLEKGEEVIPAKSTRQSEYRKVYLARRQKRGEGGNSPAQGEKHDQKKAVKGIAHKEE